MIKQVLMIDWYIATLLIDDFDHVCEGNSE